MNYHSISFFFFFNDTATTEIYTLSLHDALPICVHVWSSDPGSKVKTSHRVRGANEVSGDRKSTRLNSSHSQISYAVFCLKKKKKTNKYTRESSNPPDSIMQFVSTSTGPSDSILP